MSRARRLAVGALTRVEGEGGIDVEVVDGRVGDVRLRIYEPPRFFEALLAGRDLHDAPDITARICGICPVAYQMSACQAMEAACTVDVGDDRRLLRRLLYCGEWIESHALHIHLLHAPDLLGVESGFAMAATHGAELERGLRIKQLGNELVEVVGGRAIHPVNVRVGGFHSLPPAAAVHDLAPRLLAACDEAEAVVHWVASLTVPDHRLDPGLELVALHHPDEYGMLDGRLRSTGGLDLAPDDLLDAVAESQVPHSTALHARFLDGRPYLVGPLPRFVLNGDQLAPRARAAAEAAGLTAAERNPFRSIVVRAVEVLHALEVAAGLAAAYRPPPTASVAVTARAGAGSGWSEAPRGVLWHGYELDGDGRIRHARIVPPTSQNQAAIEADLRALVAEHLGLDDDGLVALCSHQVRSFDPCISCATHAVRLQRRSAATPTPTPRARAPRPTSRRGRAGPGTA